MENTMKIYRFLLFLTFTGLGALAAWQLFDFKAPGGLMILIGAALGFIFGLAIEPENSVKVPSFLELRSGDNWPLQRKIFAVLFLVFLSLAPFFASPKLVEDVGLGKSLTLFFIGLAFLSGTPIVFAMKSNVRLLGNCAFFLSLVLISIGLLGLLAIEIPPFVRIFSLFLGIVIPLLIVLIHLHRNR